MSEQLPPQENDSYRLFEEIHEEVKRLVPANEHLPDGPESPLGSDDGSHHLKSRPVSETRWLAEIGRQMI